MNHDPAKRRVKVNPASALRCNSFPLCQGPALPAGAPCCSTRCSPVPGRSQKLTAHCLGKGTGHLLQHTGGASSADGEEQADISALLATLFEANWQHLHPCGGQTWILGLKARGLFAECVCILHPTGYKCQFASSKEASIFWCNPVPNLAPFISPNCAKMTNLPLINAIEKLQPEEDFESTALR